MKLVFRVTAEVYLVHTGLVIWQSSVLHKPRLGNLVGTSLLLAALTVLSLLQILKQAYEPGFAWFICTKYQSISQYVRLTDCIDYLLIG